MTDKNMLTVVCNGARRHQALVYDILEGVGKRCSRGVCGARTKQNKMSF